jgi:hypothetical protein
MAHFPVNHPMRPLYRALGGLAGLYLVVFGIMGLLRTASAGFFAHSTPHTIGQGTNLAWSIICIVLGAAVLIGTAIGRNLDVAADTYIGWGLIGVGTVMLALLRTQANLFNFSVTTVIVTYLVGLALLTAGLYSRVAAREDTGTPRPELQKQAR